MNKMQAQKQQVMYWRQSQMDRRNLKLSYIYIYIYIFKIAFLDQRKDQISNKYICFTCKSSFQLA